MDRREVANDPVTSMEIALDGRQARMYTALPGIVTKVDLVKMTCEVQPAIKGTITDENNATTSVKLPLLVDVPIVFPSAGGFTFTLPLAVDDEVLVVFASRCIDSWWELSGTQMPAEFRMHDLSDGFAIPGPHSVPKVITGISTTGAQLRNNAGTTYIELTATGHIKLVAPPGLEMTGNLVVTGTVTSNGVVLSTHVHSGVTAGSVNSGPPV